MDNRRSALRTLHDFGGEIAERVRKAAKFYASAYSDSDGELYRLRGKEALLRLIRGAAFGAVSLLFASARTAMGAYPLGAAFYMAAGKNALFAYAGLAANALFAQENGLVLFIFYTLTLAVRFLLSRSGGAGLFREKLPARIALSAAAAGGAGLIKVFMGGLLWYDMLGALFSTLVAPIACLLYKFAFERLERFFSAKSEAESGINAEKSVAFGAEKSVAFGFEAAYEAGLVALAFSAVWAMKPFTLFGFSIATCAAFILALYVSKEGGILRGGVYGLVIGLAAAPMYAPVFGLAGIVAGLLWKLNGAAAISAAAVTGIAFGVYADGFASLRTFAPDLIAGGVIFAPFALLGLLRGSGLFTRRADDSNMNIEEAAVLRRRESSTLRKLEAVSEAFAELSEVANSLSQRLRKPSLFETRELVSECFEPHCEGCAMNAICVRRDYSETLAVYDALSRTAAKGGAVTRGDVPEYLHLRCRDLDRILAEINLRCADLFERTARYDKTGIFAEDYESMARIIEECSENEPDELDAELTERARGAIRYLDFAAASVSVYGGRRKTVVAGGVDLGGIKMTADELRRCFENLTGTSLTSPGFAIDSDYITMSMVSRRIFAAETASASSIKADERVNGDHSVHFESDDDRFYMLVSDGMGSGREAALTSRITAVFLEKLLGAGVEKPVALDMLGTFLRAKNAECFATVDMLELDLLDGSASFTKSGAAPSYIIRGSDLFKIASNTMPIGITKRLNAEEIKFSLRSGDIVVMVSDGVTGTLEDGTWLCELLTYERGGDLDALTRKIISSAKEHNKFNDDMTAVAILIREI